MCFWSHEFRGATSWNVCPPLTVADLNPSLPSDLGKGHCDNSIPTESCTRNTMKEMGTYLPQPTDDTEENHTGKPLLCLGYVGCQQQIFGEKHILKDFALKQKVVIKWHSIPM